MKKLNSRENELKNNKEFYFTLKRENSFNEFLCAKNQIV